MNHCACFTLPDGTVGVTRPNPTLVLALMLADRGEALRAASTIGIMPPVAGPLWDAMTARTEIEAVRVIAERDAARVARLRGLAPTAAAELAVVPTSAIPANRRFRNAWRRIGTRAPAVDMPLARLQRMDEIRKERNTRLAASDGPMLRTQEQGTPQEVALMKAYRQALRDLPLAQPIPDAITTPEALAAWEPTWPTNATEP